MNPAKVPCFRLPVVEVDKVPFTTAVTGTTSFANESKMVSPPPNPILGSKEVPFGLDAKGFADFFLGFVGNNCFTGSEVGR